MSLVTVQCYKKTAIKKTHIENFWFQFVESDVYPILTTIISENEGRLEMFMKHYAPNMLTIKMAKLTKCNYSYNYFVFIQLNNLLTISYLLTNFQAS